MAGDFLRSHGIDIDAEMARIQSEPSSATASQESTILISNVSLPSTPPGTAWDVKIRNGSVMSISPRSHDRSLIDGHGALLSPSLCHPHIHLDKAFLLSHPRYSHLQIKDGDFPEAMSLTGEAKLRFEERDLLERGQRVIDESVAAGVTHMRAFVEVDAGVRMKCLQAGLKLKRSTARNCVVQLCAFAQLPLFSSSPGDETGEAIRALMRQASRMDGVDVVGSTPYVESEQRKMEENIEWLIDLSIENNLHLDFHLDYTLNLDAEPMVWHVVRTLKSRGWAKRTHNRTVVLGHCTRLSMFTPDQWRVLRDEIGDLPISFVGLPTSDLFMMRDSNRTRGTLDVPQLIKDYGFNACIGINNIGNAFTPHGSCDPLTLACNGVGVYQTGTKCDADLLYECVSTRARQAIGCGRVANNGDGTGRVTLELKIGDSADLMCFGHEDPEWRTRKSVSEAVYLYDHCRGRKGYHHLNDAEPIT